MAGMTQSVTADASLAPPETAGRRFLRAALWGFAHVFSILLLAIAWEMAARSGAVTPFMLPKLSAVLERIWDDLLSGELMLNTGVTVYRAMVGFLIAAVAGIILGMAVSRRGIVHWFFDPIISVGFPMPKIAFLPVVILWLGVYDTSKISMVAFEAIFPVVTATIIGIRGVERELLWSARNMGAGERELLWQIALPAALPQIMTGLQVALPIALIVGIVCEMLMGGYCVALRRLAWRVCRHRGDRGRRLRAGQGHGDHSPPVVAMAPGSAGAIDGVTVCSGVNPPWCRRA
jgi:ABC-type nitrate/sulfonate/bicarbonate transport system permease component